MYFYAFYPAGLDLRLTRRPWLSWALMAFLAVVFAWQRLAPDLGPLRPDELIFRPGNGAPITAVTAIFLHGGWFHLLGNLVYLGVFAPALEDRLGRGCFLTLLLMLGAAGNLAHGWVAVEDLLGQGGLGVMGASGAISGLLGVALVRLSFARVAVAYWVFAPLAGQNRAGRQLLPLPAAVAMWLLLQVVHTLVARESGSTVSYGAHLGGFGLGVVISLLLGHRPPCRAEAALHRAREHFAAGQALAAAGEYEEYLAVHPDDRDVTRELARAEVLSSRSPVALERLRGLYRRYASEGKVADALDVYREGRHVRRGLGLASHELSDLAAWFERTGATADAVRAYQDLVDLFPADDPVCGRAWVRIVMLLHGTLDRGEEAREWLDLACARLPAGAWRDYLEAEFRPAASARGGPAPGRAAWPTGPASGR